MKRRDERETQQIKAIGIGGSASLFVTVKMSSFLADSQEAAAAGGGHGTESPSEVRIQPHTPHFGGETLSYKNTG